MINLLSRKQKRQVRSEYLAHRRITAGGLCLGLLAMGLILTAISHSHIQARGEEIAHALRDLETADVERVSSGHSLVETNRNVKLARAGATRELLYPLRQMTATAEPATLAVTEWQWQAASGEQAARLSLGGIAADRQSLLTFVAELEKLERVTSADSPISSLIANREGKFDFNIELILDHYAQGE